MVGKVSDPLLKELLHEQQKRYRALSQKNTKVKAILLDGKHQTPRLLKTNSVIQAAVQKSIPIVIANPTKEEVGAITGAQISGNAMVIVPHKRGEEYEINLLNRKRASYQSCWANFGAVPRIWGDFNIPKVIKIIDNAQNRNQNEIGEFENEAVSCHKRWTIQNCENDPYIWESKGCSQGQQIDLGFQFDLYYVTTPQPARKYLTVKTVGKGVSAGKIKAYNVLHRGYYQKEVIIKLENTSEGDWIGEGMKCEGIAPRSDNNLQQVQTSTGIQFLVGGMIGGVNYSTGAWYSFNAYAQRTRVQQLNDYTVSQDAIPNCIQWTYWMSGAHGKILRRNHQASDLIRLGKISDLPHLAKGPFLKPFLEAVYFADGNETGKQKITMTIEQHLQDLRSLGLIKREKNIHGVVSREISIDFSQVNAQCN